MKQSKKESLVEACLNTFVGWLVSMVITVYIIVPLWEVDWTLADSFWVTMVYTVAAIARGYMIRRFFNADLHLLAINIARKL